MESLYPISYNGYLFAVADNRGEVIETNEDNNIAILSNPINFRKPDVELAFDHLSLNKYVTSPNDMLIPSFLAKNYGSSTINNSLYINFYLSTDSSYSEDDVLLTHNYNTINSNTIRPESWQFITVPKVEPGTYVILGHLDVNNKYGVVNKSNNIAAAGRIEIIKESIDLEIIADPITTVMADAQMYNINYLKIKNNGTTGVVNYEVRVYASSDQILDENDKVIENGFRFRDKSDLLSANESKYVNLFNHMLDINNYLPPGINYIICEINPLEHIGETNSENNIYIHSIPVNIADYSIELKIDSVYLSRKLTTVDKDLVLNVKITNDGVGQSAGIFQQFMIEVKNSAGKFITYHLEFEYINLSGGESDIVQWTIDLPDQLKEDKYVVSIKCSKYPCYFNDYNFHFNVVNSSFVKGAVSNVSGDSLSNYQLFFYKKTLNDDFILFQSVTDTEFKNGFNINEGNYAIYCVPDPNVNPELIPTLYERSLSLHDASVLNIKDSVKINFEVLSLAPLAKGTKVIEGQIIEENTSQTMGVFGYHSTVMSETDKEKHSYQVLLSSDDKIFAVTSSDSNGFFEFTGIPDGNFQILIKTDDPLSPVSIDDISLSNADLNLSYTITNTESIHLNDKSYINKAPILHQLIDKLYIYENTLSNAIITSVKAEDNPDDMIAYFLDDEDEYTNFLFDQSGNLFINVNASLNYEEKSIYKLPVFASDQYNARSSVDTLIIKILNVNEAPIIHPQNLVIDILEKNQLIGSVNAEDPENDFLTYEIEDNENAFRIDELTGDIYVQNTLLLSSNNTFKINVQVSDGKLSSTETYLVMVGEVITGIEQNEIELQLWPNPTSNYININSKQGMIKEVNLIDTNGKVIYYEVSNNLQQAINLSSFPAGLYILTIKIENLQKTFNIIKQ